MAREHPPQSSHPSNARPPPAPRSPTRIPTHYGSLELPMLPQTSIHLLPKQPPAASPFSSPPKPLRPPAVGPLARVSSNPSFIPVMKVDLNAVASQVSRSVGAEYTTQQLLTSLASEQHPPHQQNQHHTPHQHFIDFPHEDALWESSHLDSTSQPHLKVELAQNEQHFSQEALVLKISSQNEQDIFDDHVAAQKHAAMEHRDIQTPTTTAGFAINIPVQKELHPDPFQHSAPSTWEYASPYSMSDRDFDEEDPLLPHDEVGLNMSYNSGMDIPRDGSAFVQRTGARNVAEEQEVLYAVPNGESLSQGGPTGLLLPVMDSTNDLTQLVFVVPPDTVPTPEEEYLDCQTESVTTTDGAREYVQSFTDQLPSIIDVDSTLEVHGTAANATVAMNVTKQVSWVGYAVLLVALLSVASQGTAVKWLPSVDGLIAASWLMQTQTLIMLPLAIIQYFTLNAAEHEEIRKPSIQRRIFAASLSQVCWASGFFVAIDYTTLFHAWSLNNIHALIIVLIALVRKVIMRVKDVNVSSGEIVGAQVATIGVLMMLFPLLLAGDIHTLTGDFVAIASSLGAISFLHLCKTLRNQIPLFLMMAPITALNAVIFSLGSMVLNGTDFSMTDSGALGWLRSDRIALGLYLGGVVGFLGTVCCIAALKFLPSVVVGSVQTMMPVVGTIVAIVAGLDTLPDFWTTIGGGVLLYGVLLIADATRQSEVTVVINTHIKEVGASKPNQ